MMLMTLLNMSISFKLLTNLWGRYCLFKKWRDERYKNSQTYKITQGLKDKIKIYFRYSFLERITEIKKEENNMVLNGSKVVRWIINSYKKFKLKLISYLGTSKTSNLLDEIIKGFYFFPIKNLSIIIVIATTTNIIFSIILKKEIGILGWLIRTFFLLIAFSGLLSNATWGDINKTSYFLKRINK